MRGMTAPACPVCATPYEAGAANCDFCGVSLLEPESPQPTPQADAPPSALSAAEIAAEIVAETDAPLEGEAPTEPAPAAATTAIDETDGSVDGDAVVEAAATPGIAVQMQLEDGDAEALVAAGEASDSDGDGDSDSDSDSDSEDDAAESAEHPRIPADPAPAAAKRSRPRAPSFAKAPSAASVAHRRLRRIEWGIVAGLSALLLVQMVASDFDQLAAGASTRPWLLRMCGLLRCELPPWREPQALHLLQRDVRANPRRPGTLRISASFRNDARWTQPWPRLRVTLSDSDGRAIGARDFAAGEYLGTQPTPNGIASGQVAAVAFDVIDPSPRVTAFTFEFRAADVAGGTSPR
jgi:hypothetical protein